MFWTEYEFPRIIYRWLQGTHGEENQKAKKTRRTVQVASRAIGSTSLEAILAKRNQKPEFRRAQREQAVK